MDTPTPDPTPVFQIGTAVDLASSANPSAAGQPVTITATVVPVVPEAGTPTGAVAFDVDGSANAVNVPVSAAGTATLTMASLPAGPHRVVAAYKPDQVLFSPSPEAALIQSVNAGPTPTPSPTPTPPQTPSPTPGLTLTEAIAAMTAGIMAARPFPVAGAAEHAVQAGTAGLAAAWPKDPPPA